MDRRQRLFTLLELAAELEHSLVCVYLYAGWSVNLRAGADALTPEQQVLTKDWAETTILVARQEMEHLALVNNVLLALGGAPHLARPAMPLAAGRFPLALELKPFSPEVVDSFRCWERPSDVPAEDVCGHSTPIPARYGPVGYTSIEDLYVQIKSEIVAGGESLFIGAERAQVDGGELGLNFPRLGRLGGIYDITLFKVTDVASAVRAIDLIIAEGEGSTAGIEDQSHFVRFSELAEQMKAHPELTAFAKPVAANPRLFAPADASAITMIESTFTRGVVEAFNDAYQLMCVLLAGFFAFPSDVSDEEHADTIYVTFYPLMTMVIRPLAEVIMTLPVADGKPLRAGPTFEYSEQMAVLPHETAALVIIGERLDSLGLELTRLHQQGTSWLEEQDHVSDDESAAVARLEYIARSVELTTRRWKTKIAERQNGAS